MAVIFEAIKSVILVRKRVELLVELFVEDGRTGEQFHYVENEIYIKSDLNLLRSQLLFFSLFVLSKMTATELHISLFVFFSHII